MNLIFVFFIIYVEAFELIEENFRNENFEGNTNKVECLSPITNKEVDWYFIFLMSKKDEKYIYMDNTMDKSKMMDLDIIKFPAIILTKNLNSKLNNYIIWNDDSLSKEEFNTISHSKGILAYNTNKGILLIHSLPKFPELNEEGKFKNEFPSNQGIYVQTFICISFDLNNLQKITDQMLFLKPGIQVSNISNSFHKNLDSNLSTLISNYRIKQTDKKDSIIIKDITSIEGMNFTLFSKPNYVLELPWDRHIPDYYKENLYVGTWIRPLLLPNVCDNKYKTYNILEYNIEGIKYKNSEDHSKWGYSSSVFCIGDLNRTESQLKRSGSVICMKNKTVANQVSKYPISSESCKRTKNNLLFLS